MKKPLVSIAIPTYNRADSYLRATIKNALGQTYENIEVLVSDNCSSDHTPQLVKSFSDERLTYYRQEENIGKVANENFLIEKANGDYFLLYHDDDQIDPDFVEACMEAANFRTNVGLIVTGSGVIDEEGKLLNAKENLSEGLSTDQFILSWFQQKVHMFLCSSLFGLQALKEAGGIEKKYKNYDDVAAEFKCAASHGRVDVKPIKARFRVHSGSYTKRTGESELITWCESAEAILKLACELAPSEKDKILKIGRRSSAERVYRYAAKVDSSIEQLKGYWIVFKYFGYRRPPSLSNWSSIFPFFERFEFLHGIRNSLSSLKQKYS